MYKTHQMAATHRLCLERALHLQTGEREKRDFYFTPLCTSCMPKNLKIDTETLLQIAMPYKEAFGGQEGGVVMVALQ